MKDNLLEVGDVLYIPKRYGRGYEGTATIIRTTAKLAETQDGLKVWREVDRNYVKRVGYSTYGVNSFPLATDELDAEWSLTLLRNKTKNVLDKINEKLLSKEQCELIINTLSPLKDLSK